MDPTSMIIGALALGASNALKGEAKKAVQDGYKGLKTVIIHHWKQYAGGDEVKLEQEAKVLIDNFERDQDMFLAPLEKKIATVIPEPPTELLEKAQYLYKLLDEDGFSKGKYNVQVNNSKGVQIGDYNTQTNNF